MSDEEAQVQTSSDEETVEAPPKKGRGRPKKAESEADGAADDSAGGLGQPEQGSLPDDERIVISDEDSFAVVVVPEEQQKQQELPQQIVQAPAEVEFKAPLPPDCFQQQLSILPEDFPTHQQQQQQQHTFECDFQPSQNFQFAASDFDFLLTKGQPTNGGGGVDEVPRDSLLLKFDPLLRLPVVSRLSATREEELDTNIEDGGVGDAEILSITAPQQQQQQHQQIPTVLIETAPAVEEQEPEEGQLLTALEASGFVAVSPTPSSRSDNSNNSYSMMNVEEEPKSPQQQQLLHCADGEAEDDKMSVDTTMVLDGGSESIASERNMSYTESDQDFNGSGGGGDGSGVGELNKKRQNESLKIEELEKKLADAEIREGTLLKRITDKDKTIAKMSGVVEAYERAIAELIAEKEQTTQNYEKTCEALKADSDINAQHLESLEKTFSDLHAKYERMKIITAEYKEREEELVGERNRFEESLRMQEKRYENMKSHAMTQLEIANNKLSELVRNHAHEVTKLKALLKKEEIYRASVNEQLSQKSRENEELVKICEELINGGAN